MAALAGHMHTPSPPRGGLWGTRIVSGGSSKSKKDKKKDKPRRAVDDSFGSSVEGTMSPMASPYGSPAVIPPVRLRLPRNKEECLTRFVFPRVAPPRLPTDMYGPEVFAALKTLGSGTVKVQFHAGLKGMLQRSLKNLREPPGGLVPASEPEAGTGIHVLEYDIRDSAAVEYVASLDAWLEAEAEMANLARTRHRTDLDLVESWIYRLADPVNDLLRERDTFRPGSRPRYPALWMTPSRYDAAFRQHDWVALNETEAQCVARMSWHVGASDGDVTLIYTTAAACRPPGWAIDVGPGFEIRQRNGEIVPPANLTWSSAALALTAWHGSHHYRARWGITFNASTAIVTYLAKSDTLFVSEPIYRDAGKHRDDLTIAGAMFALSAMNHADERNRPSVTMRNDAMQYYSRAHITETEWRALKDHAERFRESNDAEVNSFFRRAKDQ